MKLGVSNKDGTDIDGELAISASALIHSGVFNVPRLLRSAKVGLADDCLPAAEGHANVTSLRVELSASLH